MPRPKNNVRRLIGRAGRRAIEEEDLAREERRWSRRKATIARYNQDDKQ